MLHFLLQGYPYARPSSSFIFCNGAAYTFADSAWVTPSQWHGSLHHLLQLQVTAPDGTSSRCAVYGLQETAILALPQTAVSVVQLGQQCHSCPLKQSSAQVLLWSGRGWLHGSLVHLLQLQVSAPDGTSSRCRKPRACRKLDRF
jgi:hypothetical protein